MHDLVQLSVPLAIALILALFDVNIMIFATILIIIGLLIDFLVYVNSAPVPLPYEREHFIKSAIKSSIRWFGWLFVLTLLTVTICAIGNYLSMPFLDELVPYANTVILTAIIYYDLRKLKYTRFYYFKPIKKFVDFLCGLLEYEDAQNEIEKQCSINGKTGK